MRVKVKLTCKIGLYLNPQELIKHMITILYEQFIKRISWKRKQHVLQQDHS